jgi:Tfp pilus assembly protein PilX
MSAASLFFERRNSLFPIENHKKQQGIVLLLSLLISFILATFMYVELMHLQLNRKSFAANQKNDTLFYAVEKNKTWGITEGLRSSSPCYFPATSPNDYPLTLKNKQILGCLKTMDNITLHAVTENLGVIECEHWYRLNLLGEFLGESAQNHQVILQIVLTQPEISQTCQKKLDGGQQSWRIVI